MVIDLILDRKDGKPYNAKQFYNQVSTFNYFDCVIPVSEALDTGTEHDIRKALSTYIIQGDYSPDIVQYIYSVQWLPTN